MHFWSRIFMICSVNFATQLASSTNQIFYRSLSGASDCLTWWNAGHDHRPPEIAIHKQLVYGITMIESFECDALTNTLFICCLTFISTVDVSSHSSATDHQTVVVILQLELVTCSYNMPIAVPHDVWNRSETYTYYVQGNGISNFDYYSSCSLDVILVACTS